MVRYAGSGQIGFIVIKLEVSADHKGFSLIAAGVLQDCRTAGWNHGLDRLHVGDRDRDREALDDRVVTSRSATPRNNHCTHYLETCLINISKCIVY